jgi:hypothetical protein
MPEEEVENAWRATAVYQIIRHAMNFQVMGSTISPFRPLRPSQTLLPDRNTLLSILTLRFSGWPETDVERYANELLAESEMLKKWAGKLVSDEERLLGSLQSLAKKDLDSLKMGERERERENRMLIPVNSMEEGVDGDVEMTY